MVTIVDCASSVDVLPLQLFILYKQQENQQSHYFSPFCSQRVSERKFGLEEGLIHRVFTVKTFINAFCFVLTGY